MECVFLINLFYQVESIHNSTKTILGHDSKPMDEVVDALAKRMAAQVYIFFFT